MSDCISDPAPDLVAVHTYIGQQKEGSHMTKVFREDFANEPESERRSFAVVTGSVSISEKYEWWNHRRCAGMPPWIFYPTIVNKKTKSSCDPYSLARSICGGCGVRDECLAYAEATGEVDGFWGGEDLSARQKLAKKLARKRI